MPIANRPHNPQPCRRGKGFDLGQGAKPQAAARNHRGRAIRKGVILIKDDIIACDLDLLKPQPHRHVIGGDQGDFGPCGHPVLPWRTGRITGFKHKLPARRQNSGHRTEGLQDIIIRQQALKRVASHIDQIIALITVKALQRAVLPVHKCRSGARTGHRKHRLSRIKPGDPGAHARHLNRQRAGAASGVQHAGRCFFGSGNPGGQRKIIIPIRSV